MPIVTEQTLKNEITQKLPGSAYLLFGNDGALKKMYAKKLCALIADENDCFNFSRFSEDCDLQDVYDFAQQYPMMSDRKCLLLCDFDFEKCSETDFKRLCDILSALPDTAVLVMWFDGMEIDEKKSTRFKKLIKIFDEIKGVAARLDHRTTPDLVRTLCSAAQKRGCKMENSTARYLIEVCSADLEILKNELEKLCAFANGDGITSEMIDSVCVRSVEASVYNISRELVAKNIGNAVKMLGELLFLKIKPQVIFSVLSTAFVEMYIAKSASEAGISPSEVAAQFGYKGREFVITRAQDNARRLSSQSLALCLDELLKTDLCLKGAATDEKTVLEELMVKLVYIMSEGHSIVKA